MIEYIPAFIPQKLADAEFTRLWHALDWERRDGTPRREYWQNDYEIPYTYGSGNGIRTYNAKQWDSFIDCFRHGINVHFDSDMNCCFVNGYENEKDSLGWHADDSIEMSHDEPIIVVSLGAERNIMYRDYATKTMHTLKLGHGSLFVMPRGFQRTHEHKIPKGDRPCGPRISLTYRHIIGEKQ